MTPKDKNKPKHFDVKIAKDGKQKIKEINNSVYFGEDAGKVKTVVTIHDDRGQTDDYKKQNINR